MRLHIWERMLRFWEADRGLSIVLALLVIVIFVLPALLTPDSTGRFVADLAFSALLVAGTFTAAESRRVRLAVVGFTAATLLMRWVAAGAPSVATCHRTGSRPSLSCSCCSPWSWPCGRLNPARSPITASRAPSPCCCCSACIWASAYEWLPLVHPEPFSAAVGNAPSAMIWIYYSFVTLTTMGDGDITPVHPIARSLAIAEA